MGLHPGIGIQIKLESRQVSDAIDRIIELGQNPIPMNRAIASMLVAAQPKHISEQEDEFGNKWVPLKASTIAIKQRLGYSTTLALVRTGEMAGSFTSIVRSDEIAVGTPKRQAPVQFFGTEGLTEALGVYGLSGRGKVSIPAREFLYVNEEEEDEMLKIGIDYIEQAIDAEPIIGGWQ